MLSQLLHPLRSLVQAVSDPGSSGRIAFGFALGVILGLIPKGNLTAVVLGMIFLSTRANLLAAAGATAIFTWAGIWTDPLAHRIGAALLTPAWVQPVGAWLYDRPLFPWTGLNNTVVLGSLVLGLLLFYPAYFLVRQTLDRYRPRIAAKLERYRTAEVLAGVNTVQRWRVR